MPKTVSAAFSAFRSDYVDLDSHDVKEARASRNYLVSQIAAIAERDTSFPALLSGHLKFGSFARGTKIIEIDDIDLMIFMSGYGGTEITTFDPYRFKVFIDNTTAPIYRLRGDDGYINSIRVLNKFKAELSQVHNYQKADLHRRMQAVTLKLTTYPWTFDIVPTFPVAATGMSDDIHYLIPNGTGQWIRTDPRRDKEHLDRLKAKHGDILLPLLRLLKCWNTNGAQPRLGSYYFETIALKALDIYTAGSISYLQIGLRAFFMNAGQYVVATCPDPKGLGADLDANVDWEKKMKVKAAIETAAYWSDQAVTAEIKDNHSKAIACWQRVFGSEFPEYG